MDNPECMNTLRITALSDVDLNHRYFPGKIARTIKEKSSQSQIEYSCKYCKVMQKIIYSAMVKETQKSRKVSCQILSRPESEHCKKMQIRVRHSPKKSFTQDSVLDGVVENKIVHSPLTLQQLGVQTIFGFNGQEGGTEKKPATASSPADCGGLLPAARDGAPGQTQELQKRGGRHKISRLLRLYRAAKSIVQ